MAWRLYPTTLKQPCGSWELGAGIWELGEGRPNPRLILTTQKAPLVLRTNSELRLGLPSVPVRVARFGIGGACCLIKRRIASRPCQPDPNGSTCSSCVKTPLRDGLGLAVTVGNPGLPQRQLEAAQTGLKKADLPDQAQLTTGLLMDRRLDHRHLREVGPALGREPTWSSKKPDAVDIRLVSIRAHGKRIWRNTPP